MVQILLIRPGSTEYDLQSRIQGTLDIPLCHAGQKEAAQIIEGLRPYLAKVLYCCPCSSALETASIIGKALRLKPKTIELLQNVNLGLWQGTLVEDVRRKQPKVYKQWQEHPETVQPPEGETLAQVVTRVDEALEKLARKHRNSSIALIVPEPLASIIRYRIEGTKLDDLWKVNNGCQRIEVLRLEPGFATAASSSVALGQASQNGKGDQNGDSVLDGANNQSHDSASQPPVPHARSRIVYRGVSVEGR